MIIMRQIFILVIVFGLRFISFSQTGSVGIGTTTPHSSAALDVQSTEKGMLVPRMTTAQRTAISNAATGLLVFDNTTGTFWFYNGNAWMELVGGGGSGQWTQNGNNIYNSNMGNVGIGTLAPAFKLDVLGRMRIKTGTLNNVNTSAGVWMDDYRDGSNRFFFGMKDSIRAGFYGGGAGGVGWNLLFNARTGRFSNQFGMDGDINVYNGSYNLFDGVTNHFSGSISADSNDIYINAKRSQISTSTGDLILQVGSSRVNPPMGAGNVGIGIDSPYYKLSLKGDMAFYNGNDFIGFLGKSSGSNFLMNARQGNLIADNIPSNLILQYPTGIAGNTAGDVGIGTDLPESKLHIAEKGPTKFIIGQSHTGGNATALYMGTSAASNGYAYLQGVSSAGSSYGNLIINQNGGNVGVGLINPEGQMHITGNGQTTMVLGRSHISGGYTAMYLGTSALSGGYVYLQGVQSGGAAYGNFLINQNGGDVGIGTSTLASGYKLNVGGKVICEELKVQLQGNWPDYVFANDYKLKTFDELRSFISTNKHLPNIPASAELEKNGIEVGEMQRKMMEKIEELTLYVLQLENELNKLKKQGDQK